jgi:Icc-related predicted phosphoesterase
MTSRGIRIAAVGDLHLRPAVRGHFRPAFLDLVGRADLLLLAGDLTNGGTPQDADLLYAEVRDLPIPVIAVLGNHDYDDGHGPQIASQLIDIGVAVLDGDSVALDVDGTRVAVAGVIGGGGGFPDHGGEIDPENEGLVVGYRLGHDDARRLHSVLEGLDGDVRIALMHFAPIPETLIGEPVEIYPGLGYHGLADAIDHADVDLAIHGHAHAGSECGRTPGGVPVRNVAHPVLRHPYVIYELVDGQVKRVDHALPDMPRGGA